jgi:hypothetical protein
MAATTVFDGTLAANTPGSWVAVASSRAYTVQVVGGQGLGVQVSVDGTNVLDLNQKLLLVSSSQTDPKTYSLIDTPVAWMRANNSSSASITGKVYTALQ